MILVLDNYDSFVFNLVQVLGETGEEVAVFRNDAVTAEEIEGLKPECIVLSPGPGTPDGAGISLDIIRAFSGRIPIFGVCLGHQTIGQAFGCRVIRAPMPVHGKTSAVFHDGRTLFRDVPQGFQATRYHSLILDKASLPGCLEVSAWTGDGIVMGVRHKDAFVEGVQFHPESILTGPGKKILMNLLAGAFPAYRLGLNARI
ncbi:aminodeoxychorismate/anthranilate synthase component II [bacterium]|nr:aminodeoxychorismate/anthranilate synthase component II [bacterium]